MKSFEQEKWMLPAFPSTPHVPYQPNLAEGDVVASERECQAIFGLESIVNLEEKLDGASVGVTIHDGHPVIRNRDHILNKGFMRKADDTPAKRQFRPLWNYFYDNSKKFQSVIEAGPFSIYGEWMLMQHGLKYDKLPSYFVAYDVYDYEVRKFLDPKTARKLLIEAGFNVPMQYNYGTFLGNFETLAALAQFTESTWAADSAKIEGLYIKLSNGEHVTDRFKMVRPDFEQGCLWSEEMKMNCLR